MIYFKLEILKPCVALATMIIQNMIPNICVWLAWYLNWELAEFFNTHSILKERVY